MPRPQMVRQHVPRRSAHAVTGAYKDSFHLCTKHAIGTLHVIQRIARGECSQRATTARAAETRDDKRLGLGSCRCAGRCHASTLCSGPDATTRGRWRSEHRGADADPARDRTYALGASPRQTPFRTLSLTGNWTVHPCSASGPVLGLPGPLAGCAQPNPTRRKAHP